MSETNLKGALGFCLTALESVAVNICRRSYTIVAGVIIDKPEAEGVLFAHGGVGGGHSLFVKDKKLHYMYNWLGKKTRK